MVEWPVSKLMNNRGYIDSFREANPNPTKTLDGTWGFLSDEIISDRIDFIYYKGNNIKTKYSKIVQEDPIDGFFNFINIRIRKLNTIYNKKYSAFGR